MRVVPTFTFGYAEIANIGDVKNNLTVLQGMTTTEGLYKVRYTKNPWAVPTTQNTIFLSFYADAEIYP